MHLHVLRGCTPTPLAHYLKALGILRIVSEQADDKARGFWKDETFCLLTRLSQEQLELFFLKTYSPTPLIAPWNGGSGFYAKDNKLATEALSKSNASRFENYRTAILLAQKLVTGLETAPKNEEKALLLRRLRGSGKAVLVDWIDAAVSISSDGSASYPALLGTGGNDGRLDFTNNFMQRLCSLFELESPTAGPNHGARELLRGALFDDVVRGLSADAIGQFIPGAAGGANSDEGYSAKSHLNLWDFVLAMEGAVCFRSSIVRRGTEQGKAQAAAPFATRPMAASYGSAAASDESARGEQWMPLWNRATSWEEVEAFLREGRSRIGGGAVKSPLDFARSLTRIGVARGVTEFQRYGYQERNGQANLAVPLGRWSVRSSTDGILIDDVSPWVERLRQIASDQHAPGAYQHVSRSCSAAILVACKGGATSTDWQDFLRYLVRAERLALSSPKFAVDKNCQPLPSLSPGWLETTDDGSAEFRLAAALASLTVSDKKAQRSIREYWLPLESGARPRFLSSDSSLTMGPSIVGRGHDLVADLIAILLRRSMDRERKGNSLELYPYPQHGRFASPADISQFLSGDFDDLRCLELALGFMAIDWRKTAPKSGSTSWERTPPAAYAFLKLANPLGEASLGSADEAPPRLDRATLQRLANGDLPGAVEVAYRRLRSAGIYSKARVFIATETSTRRLAASLLFPLTLRDLRYLRSWLMRPAHDSTRTTTTGDDA